jgi:hypothetical protein
VRKFWISIISSALLAFTVSIPSNAVTYPDNASVTFKEAPFLISLWTYNEDTYEREQNFCSGVLIDSRTFLTAAHCLVDGTPFVVVTNQQSKFDRGEVLSVYDYRIHPRYSKSTSLNDIAVGVLNFPSRYNSDLWSNTKKNADFSKTSNWIYGWGRDQNEIDTGFPMGSKLNDFSKSASRFFKKFNPQTQIAAGKYNSKERVFSGACFGDSGGPLVASHNGKNSVIGITSYGSSKGCDVEIPTVFAKVKYYRPFIQEIRDKLIADFNRQNTTFPNLDEVSLLPDTDKYLTRFPGEDTYYSSAQLQKGGGVSPDVDVNSVMFQTYKEKDGYYDFRIGAYLTSPVEACSERQKGKWLVQVALDNRQKVDFAFQINPSSGCYTPNKMEFDIDTILKTPPAQGVCNDIGVNPWSPIEKESQTKTKIDSFSFFFKKACIGTSKKIWIRIYHSVDGRGDIEPGPDMWAGPFSTERVGEVSNVTSPASFTAYLDKVSYRIGEVAYLVITGKDSTGNLLGSGVPLASSSSDFKIDFAPHIFRVTPKASDFSINGKWTYELIISSVEGTFSGKVKLPNLEEQTVPYRVIR